MLSASSLADVNVYVSAQVNIARQMHFNFTTPDYERQKTIGLYTPKRHRDLYLRCVSLHCYLVLRLEACYYALFFHICITRNRILNSLKFCYAQCT